MKPIWNINVLYLLPLLIFINCTEIQKLSNLTIFPLRERGFHYLSSRYPDLLSKPPPSTPNPCLHGVCNGTCCGSESIEKVFDCANGQKINGSLVCNRENDCDDGSDESICDPWEPKLTALPKLKVELFCGDKDKARAGTLTLECKSAGFPTPLIRWKKYEGHVPSKCQQYSINGHGILKCPDFEQSDQGAYSCVAENSVKLAESQPKSIVKCSNKIHCKGFTVVNGENIEHCLECFCSGRTSQCQSIKSNPTVIEIPFPKRRTEIFLDDKGNVLFVPTKTDVTDFSITAGQSSTQIEYCHLTENDLQGMSFLKSFGRSIIIPRSKSDTENIPKAPALIIGGNGISLMYTAKLITPPKNSNLGVSVRLWPGNWHHLNKTAASRADLMKILCNVDTLLIRCEYKPGAPENWSQADAGAKVLIESSVITNSSNSVSYVEKCHCPVGFDGLSCETCAEGYKKKPWGESFYCEKIYVPCRPGYTGTNCSACDATNGYIRRGGACVKPTCHPDGTKSVGKSKNCICKVGVTGDYCDQCEPGYFNLNPLRGCDKCWCSGVSNRCDSSHLYRTLISNIPRGGYNYSDGRNFWLLPPDFSGNRLTSYGGFFNYTMEYKPHLAKESKHLTVEILNEGDITLSYTHNTMDTSMVTTTKSWSIPLTEANWKKTDKSPVNKGEFLTVLSRIKAIYIESPYHLTSGKVTLKSILMSSASANDDGSGEVALAVEQCICPEGYTGLSCERCKDGYYKKRNGTMTMCIKCNCTNCDPDFGCPVCPELKYRDNPEEEKMPVCKPCPCQENGVSCFKDDYNQIFCHCKPGFTGIHCENEIPAERDELTITITPRRVREKKAGSTVIFNCTVLTSEEMVLTAKKIYRTSPEKLLKSSETLAVSGHSMWNTFEVQLEEGLNSVECFVHDEKGKLAGHIVAKVEGFVTRSQKVEITNCYSDKIDAKEAQSKELICEAKGLPKPTITWYKKVGTEIEKVDTTDGVHTIKRALLSDNGTIYTCTAENSRGDKTTCSKVLIVRKKCEVINIFPREVSTKEGHNVSIECKTTAKSPVAWAYVSWKTMPSALPPGTTVTDGVLHINNATVSHSGTYICRAMGGTGEINKTVSVTVEKQQEPPSVVIVEDDTTLKVGENITVHCTAHGKPTPKLTWRKTDGVLESNVDASGNTMTITKARIENSGVYSCKAHSKAGQATSLIAITVEYEALPPELTVSKEAIQGSEGERVNVSCLASGYPRPKLSYSAPNISILSSVSVDPGTPVNSTYESEKVDLVFNISKQIHGSRLICIAENSAGRKEMAIKIQVFEQKEAQNARAEFVDIGSYFEVICESKVTKLEKLTVDKVEKLAGDECPIPNGLMIPSVQVQHNGTYVCKVGSVVKETIHLLVKGFVPKFTKSLASYMVLPLLPKLENKMHVEMTLKPTRENGILLQENANNFDIYLQERILIFGIYSQREGRLEVSLNKLIELGKWYTIVASVSMTYLDITVYNETMSILERKTKEVGNLGIDLKSMGNFFVGGPTPRARKDISGRIPRPQIQDPFFDGSISRLIIDHHEFDIVRESSFSYNVTLLRRCSEKPNPCLNRGVCFDAPTQYGFVCVCSEGRKRQGARCPASCTAKSCETQFDLCRMLNPCKPQFQNNCEAHVDKLVCQLPYGYSDQEYSFCSNGTGYVKLRSNLLERHLGKPEVIKMKFILYSPEAQLLWQGNTANYLSISVHQGKMKYVYFNQHKKLEIHDGKLQIKTKYSFTLKRVNSSATLEIEQTEHKKLQYLNSIPSTHTNRVVGDIYLGNVPNGILPRYKGLNGCIYSVAFGDRKKVNLKQEALEIFASLPKSLYFEDEDYSSSGQLSNEVF